LERPLEEEECATIHTQGHRQGTGTERDHRDGEDAVDRRPAHHIPAVIQRKETQK